MTRKAYETSNFLEFLKSGTFGGSFLRNFGDQNHHPNDGIGGFQKRNNLVNMAKNECKVVVPPLELQVCAHNCARVGQGSVSRILRDQNQHPAIKIRGPKGEQTGSCSVSSLP